MGLTVRSAKIGHVPWTSRSRPAASIPVVGVVAAALATASFNPIVAKSVAAPLMMSGVVIRNAIRATNSAGHGCRWPVSPRAMRSATAMIVRVGLEPPEVTNTLLSAT